MERRYSPSGSFCMAFLATMAGEGYSSSIASRLEMVASATLAGLLIVAPYQSHSRRPLRPHTFGSRALQIARLARSSTCGSWRDRRLVTITPFPPVLLLCDLTHSYTSTAAFSLGSLFRCVGVGATGDSQRSRL